MRLASPWASMVGSKSPRRARGPWAAGGIQRHQGGTHLVGGPVVELPGHQDHPAVQELSPHPLVEAGCHAVVGIAGEPDGTAHGSSSVNVQSSFHPMAAAYRSTVDSSTSVEPVSMRATADCDVPMRAATWVWDSPRDRLRSTSSSLSARRRSDISRKPGNTGWCRPSSVTWRSRPAAVARPVPSLQWYLKNEIFSPESRSGPSAPAVPGRCPMALQQSLVPTVLEESSRGERAFDIFSLLLRERIVFLGQEVDDQIANLIISQMLYLEAQDPEKDIALYINSPGGMAYAGMAIYDVIQHVRPDVSTICVGMGMSAAAMVLAGGAAGKRFALPNARIMIHQGSAGTRGAPSELEIQLREVLALTHRMAEIIAHHLSLIHISEPTRPY